jgi:Flp pilus assembly protein TadG
MRPTFARLSNGLRRLAAERRGAVVIPLALALPVLFGFAMLVIDAGRYYNLQTSLQGGTDALALAAAAELDGRDDSITRANRAIDNLLANDQRFGQGTAAITRSSIAIRFLASLPANESEGITAVNVTTAPRQARFVEVTANPVGFVSFFATAANAVSPTATTATAVAGFDSVACNVTPLFMCNPFEGTGTTLPVGASDPTFRRRVIAMKEKGTQYFPGNYGYLQQASGSGASAVKDGMAMARPLGCYKQKGVELRTGNISGTAEALNVRFDLYDGGYKTANSDPAFRPAVNVRKGFTGAACNPTRQYNPSAALTGSEPATGFPRDPCFFDNSCSYGGAATGGRIGDGRWDFEKYWAISHPGRARPNGWNNSEANRPSRYAVYRYEIDNNLVGDLSVGPQKESGAPQCYSGGAGTVTDDPDRRTFVAAILDCRALDEQYGISGSSAPPVPVNAYARFFITEPMDKNDATIWAELVELVEPGTDGARTIIRDTVQLVR